MPLTVAPTTMHAPSAIYSAVSRYAIDLRVGTSRHVTLYLIRYLRCAVDVPCCPFNAPFDLIRKLLDYWHNWRCITYAIAAALHDIIDLILLLEYTRCSSRTALVVLLHLLLCVLQCDYWLRSNAKPARIMLRIFI